MAITNLRSRVEALERERSPRRIINVVYVERGLDPLDPGADGPTGPEPTDAELTAGREPVRVDHVNGVEVRWYDPM